MAVPVVATGTYCEAVTDTPPPLKELVRESTGTSVRRVGRFIQLALIGAGRAAGDVPANTAIYLGSGRGDLDAMAEALETICVEKQAPRPLLFINTVSNAACFYVARTLELQAASHFVSSRHFALESALQSALVDMRCGAVDSALLGIVDVVAGTAAEHAQRVGLAAGQAVAEASHWLQLQRDPGARPVLGTVDAVEFFGDRAQAQERLEKLARNGGTFFAPGQYLGSEAADWSRRLALDIWRSEPAGHFDSRAAGVLCDFLERGSGCLLHLNRDPRGRYAAVVVSR
ncbi:MAG: hypothetical protein U5K56_19545 [Halioglobus sp.]|nr:hypothetical protein [Halioglobus sp.]